MRLILTLMTLPLFVLGCADDERAIAIKPVATRPNGGSTKPEGAKQALLFGDSLATSLGARQEKQKLSACFARITGQTSVLKAQEGATSREVLAQVRAAKTENAGLVFLSVGGNDVIQDLYGSNFSENESYRNFQEIVRELKERPVQIVFLMLNPPYRGSERLPRLGQIAQSENLIVVNGLDGLWDQRKYMTDEIHPNDAGYQVICNRIRAALQLKAE